MTQVYFPNHASQLSISNALAFKEGELKGPCLKYQQLHPSNNTYSHKLESVWQKKTNPSA